MMYVKGNRPEYGFLSCFVSQKSLCGFCLQNTKESYTKKESMHKILLIQKIVHNDMYDQ